MGGQSPNNNNNNSKIEKCLFFWPLRKESILMVIFQEFWNLMAE
jgi:hypothetical protein